jgi:hypothetical protein
VKFRQSKGILNTIACFSLDKHSKELEENVNSGIIYLKSTVATTLFSLSRTFPLDRCTYVGEDNGAKILRVAKTHV